MGTGVPSRRAGGRDVKLNIHLHLETRLGLNGATPLIPYFPPWSSGKKTQGIVMGKLFPTSDLRNMLLNIAYKIYAILLNNRLSEIIEDELGYFQMGFRPNRPTIDNIFMLRQIFEKCYE